MAFGPPRGSAGGVSMSATVVLSKNYLEWTPDTGFLLTYFAEMVRSTIQARTDKGVNADGGKFAPYAVRRAISGLDADDTFEDKSTGTQWWAEDANPPRDSRGRWTAVKVRGPGDLVSLRGLQKGVPDDRRMRQNLIISPKKPGQNTNTVRIRLSGSRKDDSGNSFSHEARAKSIQTGKAPPQGGTNPARIWMAVSKAEWASIVSMASKEAALAFIVKRKQQVQDDEQQLARRKLDRLKSKVANAEKRARRTAMAAISRARGIG